MILPMVTFTEAKQEVAKLVAKYETLPIRTLNRYDEENTKKDFVLPLFHHLGWEVDNLTEVAAEEKASSGRVDYAFKLGGVSRFYVEVKPLREDLSNRTDWAKQAITYAENKGVTWAILTNFKQLMLFNAEWDEPNLDRARFLNLTCHDYEPDFAKLWWLSKESIEKGILNEEARKVGALKPKLPVEKSLYNQLLKWRTDLFNQIFHYQKDKGVNLRQTDELIQQFINRLVFIRNVEDRGIEENKLRAALHQWRIGGREGDLIDRIRDIFRNFASVYDSDLFPLLDAWDSVFVESGTIERIIDGLYERPTRLAGYDFAAIDADILGAVYEQYLSYVAQVAQEQARREAAQARLRGFEEPVFELEAKRLKRKQQGIYYTPKFVVDYIVRETVGHFLKERDHNEIVNVKILDLACGSGSFLIRAYDELLNYHAYQKGKSPAELDQWERLPILTGNIFGVDLDRQAVEIARLNLLLRSLSKQETLPSLADNIRQGNSLISGSEDELRHYFGDNWQEKKPFNWQTEFKDIMAKGGFDVVISNPPYVRIQSLPRDEADYYREQYLSAFGSFDIYVLFLEQGIRLLKPNGRLGFITSGKFLKADYGKKIQQLLRKECTVETIVDLSVQKVFAEATTYPVIMVVRKGAEDKTLRYTFVPHDLDLYEGAQPVETSALPTSTTNQDAIVKRMWPPAALSDKLLARLAQNTVPLRELSDRVFVGLQTSADDVYILEKRSEPSEGKVKVYSRSLGKELQLESTLLKPLLSGKDIERYSYPIPNHLLLFPYKVSEGKAELIPSQEFTTAYPKCWEYLLQNKETLENRERGKMRHGKWYAYVYPKNLALHDCPKLAIPRLVSKLAAVYDGDGSFYLDNVDVGGLILRELSDSAYLYITGLLNSRLLDYYLHLISVPFRGGFYSANRQFLEPLPIRHIDFDNPADKKTHDDLVALVDRMLELNKRLAPIRNRACSEQEELLRQFKRTDQEIDNLVYDLYGLTEEERKVVEEATRSR